MSEPAATAAAVRPRLTAKGAATRARIVDAAADLIFHQGVAGTGIEDVQRQARVSASQLYHYFTDKQALVHAVVDRQGDAVLAGQQPLLGQLDSLAGLRAWRDLLIDGQRQRQCRGGCVIGSLASELADTDPAVQARLADSFDRWQAEIRDGLTRMRQRGELRADADPDALALALLAAVQGGLLLNQTRRDTLALETAMDTMIAHIAGLTTTRKPPRTSTPRTPHR